MGVNYKIKIADGMFPENAAVYSYGIGTEVDLSKLIYSGAELSNYTTLSNLKYESGGSNNLTVGHAVSTDI